MSLLLLLLPLLLGPNWKIAKLRLQTSCYNIVVVQNFALLCICNPPSPTVQLSIEAEAEIINRHSCAPPPAHEIVRLDHKPC